MKTKKQKAFERKPRKMNHPFQRKGADFIEIQEISWDTNNSVLCAGVHYVPEITPKIAYRIATSWARWRRWYDNLPENQALNYPAKQDHGKRVAGISLFPIDTPKESRLDVYFKGGIAI